MSENSEERDRGVLTPTDRQFLRGEKEYKNPETTSHRRSDIRTRLRNAVLDLSLLFECYDEHDDLVTDVFRDDELVDEFGNMIALIFCGVTSDVTLDGSRLRSLKGPAGIHMTGEIEGVGDHHSSEFLQVLGDGLSRGLFEFDSIFLEKAQLETEAIRLPDRRIRRNLEEGETLHPNAAALLLRTGEVDPEAFTDFAREQLLEGGDSDAE